MRSQDFDSDRVSIPFKVNNGEFEFYRGGPLPRLREGSFGELIVQKHSILDEEAREALADNRDVPFLKKGTTLLAALYPTGGTASSKIGAGLRENVCGHAGVFGEIVLMETLLLQLRGGKLPTLVPVKCHLPALECDAGSLNHAYTLLSEKFEPHRSSHTGNVFTKVFLIRDEKLVRLDDLRGTRDYLFEKRFGAAREGSDPEVD